MSTILQQIRERNAEAQTQPASAGPEDFFSLPSGGTYRDRTNLYGRRTNQSEQPTNQSEQPTNLYGEMQTAKDAQSIQAEHPTNLYGETVQPASAGNSEDRLAAVEEANKILVEALTEMAATISHHQSALEVLSEVPEALEEFLVSAREEQSKVNLDTALKIDMLKSLVTDLQETISEDNDEGAGDEGVHEDGLDSMGLSLGYDEIGVILEPRPAIGDLDGNEAFTAQLASTLMNAADLGMVTIEDADRAVAFLYGEGEEGCPTRERVMEAEPPKEIFDSLTEWWFSYEGGTIYIPKGADIGESILGIAYGTQTAVSSEQVIGCLKMLMEKDD